MRFLSSVIVTLGVGVVCLGVSASAQRGGGAQGATQPVTIEQNEAAMKQIGQSNGAMQKAIKGNDLAAAAMEAKTLVTQFTLVERFWTQHKKDDAVKLAMTARQGASDVVAAATAGDQMKAQMSAADLGGTCKQCHSMYREGNPKEGFRIAASAGITQ